MIPVVDVLRQNKDPAIFPEIYEAINRVVFSGQYVLGPEVEVFEGAWATATGAEAAVGVSSGTLALQLLLESLPHEDPERRTVLLPALTFPATAEAVIRAGWIPQFVDVDEYGLLCLDHVSTLLQYFGEAVAAVVPVALWGRLPNLKTLTKIRDRFQVPIIIDAAQAHGAHWEEDGFPVGTHFPCAWSFFPGKILGAMGDAGAVTGKYSEVEDVRTLRNHGRLSKHRYEVVGTNARMDEIQAAILSVKLLSLSSWCEARTFIADQYMIGLDLDKRLEIRLSSWETGRAWYTFQVFHPTPEVFCKRLSELGIATNRYYPFILPELLAYEKFVVDEDAYEQAYDLSRTTFSLPLFPEMTDGEVKKVIEAVNQISQEIDT